MVNEEEDLLNAWSYALDNSRGNIKGVILEEFICFDYEFTLLSIRTSSKENIYCLPIGHEQFKGDYQSSWHPMEISERILNEAQDIANKLLDNLDGAGLYGVEFFVKNNTLIFSELSPRPHDTGMVTILSQNLNEFELHLRAILNIPIPKIKILKPAASRVILSKGDYKEFYLVNLDEALKIEDTNYIVNFRIAKLLHNNYYFKEASKYYKKSIGFIRFNKSKPEII